MGGEQRALVELHVNELTDDDQWTSDDDAEHEAGDEGRASHKPDIRGWQAAVRIQRAHDAAYRAQTDQHHADGNESIRPEAREAVPHGRARSAGVGIENR